MLVLVLAGREYCIVYSIHDAPVVLSFSSLYVLALDEISLPSLHFFKLFGIELFYIHSSWRARILIGSLSCKMHLHHPPPSSFPQTSSTTTSLTPIESNSASLDNIPLPDSHQSHQHGVPIPAAPPTPQRRGHRYRRKYNDDERLEVKAVRAIGACDDCRNRRVKVFGTGAIHLCDAVPDWTYSVIMQEPTCSLRLIAVGVQAAVRVPPHLFAK